MKVTFRVDSSLTIGTGHLYRCLTLAEKLREKGAICTFITRDLTGNINALIKEKDFINHILPAPSHIIAIESYESWLEVPLAQECDEVSACLKHNNCDLLVVDSYALDYRWEEKQAPYSQKILVIDDLYNRKHHCDFILNQNFLSNEMQIRQNVQPTTHILSGLNYCLLRDEFYQNRAQSLKNRENTALQKILISLGGVDNDNETAKVLKALESFTQKTFDITVILGKTAPHFKSIYETSKTSRHNVTVLQGIANMAQLLSRHDMAIGAAGSSMWERCVLGIPSITLVLAENQRPSGENLAKQGATWLLELNGLEENLHNDLTKFINDKQLLAHLTTQSSALCEGRGAERVADLVKIKKMKKISNEFLRLKRSDIEMVRQWRNLPRININMVTQNYISEENQLKWFNAVEKDKSQQHFIFTQNQKPIGLLSFKEIGTDKLNWGCYIAEERVYPGSGLILEVAALDYAFYHLKQPILNAEVLDFNKPAQKMHQLFKYEYTGSTENAIIRDEQQVAMKSYRYEQQAWLNYRQTCLEKLPKPIREAIETIQFTNEG